MKLIWWVLSATNLVFWNKMKIEKRKTKILFFNFQIKIRNWKVKYRQNIKKSAIYWISITIIGIKNENKHSILNFVSQFIMKMKLHFGYTDLLGSSLLKKSLFQLIFWFWKFKEDCKISVITVYKATLHLKSSNFRKHCTLPLKF